jgi:hypothetical protein
MAASRRSWPRRHVWMARRVEGGLAGSQAAGPVCRRRRAGCSCWPVELRTGWWRTCSGGEETFQEEHSWSPEDCSPRSEAPESKIKAGVIDQFMMENMSKSKLFMNLNLSFFQYNSSSFVLYLLG